MYLYFFIVYYPIISLSLLITDCAQPFILVKHTAPKDGQEVHVVDGHPFVALQRELGRVPISFQGATNHKVDRGFVQPLHDEAYIVYDELF